LSLKALFFATFLFSLASATLAAHAETFNVYFKSAPRFELLRPFADPASFSVLVTGADGRGVEGGSVRLRLDAPAPSRVFSTDYPIVEGTRLLDLTLPLTRGRAEWKYLLPVRGEYRLYVDVEKQGAKIASQSFDFSVRENQKKWVFLSGFLLLLFGAGLIAGRIFTGVSAPAALVVLALLGAASLAAHDKTPARSPASEAIAVTPATVGKMSSIRWRLPDAELGKILPILLTLTITHLEKQKTVFAVDKIWVGPAFSMDFQFADGAEHRVRAIAEQLGRPAVQADQVVNVTGVEPPVSAMAPAMVIFVLAMAAGLLAGRWSKRKAINRAV